MVVISLRFRKSTAPLFTNLGVHILLIGQVAELTGTTRKAIRHYEAIELIPSPKRSGSYRVYSDHDVMVISMIRRAQALGFSLKELKDIVSRKIADQKLPIPLVSAQIDNKVIELEKEALSLQSKIENLNQFKIDLIKEFS
ncbi:transcriptional regulator [Psychromonas sp. B3M02]|nr:transcriptional regulator [Psychromonas sp. B3M02]